MKSTIVLGIGATLLASCSGNKQKTEEKVTQQQKPNVIFLIADDIGYGDLSCNGSKTIHTPNVDKLAAQGLRFTDAHSVAATSTPSRYSLFTGHYAWRRNDTGIAAGNAGMVIRPEQPTVADMFRECGYTTGAIGKWHLGLSDRTEDRIGMALSRRDHPIWDSIILISWLRQVTVCLVYGLRISV